LQVGDSHEIYEKPRSSFVADFIGDINLIDAEVTGARRARLGNGVEVGIADGHPSTGPITLALRPERLALHRSGESPPDGRNQLRARITRRTYYGDVYFYDVDAGLTDTIEVKEENRPDIGTHEVGDEVVVSWSVGAANLVGD
jgi:ABC-type Fe3+/spermidine/putrescine transport system ATPase subunit